MPLVLGLFLGSLFLYLFFSFFLPSYSGFAIKIAFILEIFDLFVVVSIFIFYYCTAIFFTPAEERSLVSLLIVDFLIELIVLGVLLLIKVLLLPVYVLISFMMLLSLLLTTFVFLYLFMLYDEFMDTTQTRFLYFITISFVGVFWVIDYLIYAHVL